MMTQGEWRLIRAICDMVFVQEERIQQLESTMSSFIDQVRAMRAEFDSATTAIANRIQSLLTRLDQNDANNQALLNEFRPVLDELKTMGSGQPGDPVPMPPNPEGNPTT